MPQTSEQLQQKQKELEQQLRIQLLEAEAQQKPKKQEEPSDDWLITYADSITLLLAFFVLILSVSDINPAKFQAINDSLNQGLLNKETVEVRNPLLDLEQTLSGVLDSYEINPVDAIVLDGDELRIQLPGEVLFASASASLEGQSEDLLIDIAIKLREFDLPNYNIEIEGHSDDVPIHTRRFPSNWELSSARAISVLRLFMDQEVPKDKLKAIGYADSRPKAPNRNELGEAIPANQQLNRRVEIKVSKNYL